MPAPRPVLTTGDVERLTGERCLAGAHDGRVGIEIEWVPAPLDDPVRAVDFAALRSATAGACPTGSRVTFEPGGQVELSTPPLPGLGAACSAMADDAQYLRRKLAGAGVGLVGVGLDPRPMPGRRVDTPRYAAMEAYFDSRCAAGRRMMRATAAIQVNIDAGADDATRATRWRRAHEIGPTLAAAFANSPLDAGGSSGWRSTRLAVWADVDACRTAVADDGSPDARASWARYVLDADVMLIRRGEDDFVPLLDPLSFGHWVEAGHELGYPTIDDLEYHLTTLFPPVRPRGWLELRMIDTVPDPWWRAAVAVATTLVVDDAAAQEAEAAVRPARDLWTEAARDGLSHPDLARSARACFAATRAALERVDTDDATAAAVSSFEQRYVARARCPADDRLAEWAEHGALLPEPDGFAAVRA